MFPSAQSVFGSGQDRRQYLKGRLGRTGILASARKAARDGQAGAAGVLSGLQSPSQTVVFCKGRRLCPTARDTRPGRPGVESCRCLQVGRDAWEH